MKRICIIVGIALAVPYIITLLLINRRQISYKKYEIAESGKTVVMEDGQTDVEKFIPLVLMARMDIGAEEEALKVQAVLIRTYIAKKLEEKGSDSIAVKDLNLKYISYDKLEKMWGDEFAEKYNYLNKIICNTSMEILMYEDKIITPYYHQASCGRTREGKAGYLKPVESSGDASAKNFLTIKYYTAEEVQGILEKEDAAVKLDAGDIAGSIALEKKEGAEYVEKVRIGESEMTGEKFAGLFQLPSSAFIIENYEEQVRMISKGEGHGYGVSMYGACAMAEKGASYKDILGYYYKQITVNKYP